MKIIPQSPAKIAGLLSLLSAGLFLAVWYILLFVAIPPRLSVTEAVVGQLQYVFSVENPRRWYFVWLAIPPLLCVVIGSLYLMNLARSRAIAFLLLASTICLGIAVFAFNTWEFAFFVTLPAFWGWRCLPAAQLHAPPERPQAGFR